MCFFSTAGVDVSTSKKSVSINNPSSKKRKISPINSSSAHTGSKVNKVKGGRLQDVHEAKRQLASWSQQLKQHQQSNPSADNWSGNYHQRYGTQDPGRSVSSKERLAMGKQLQTQAADKGCGEEGGEGEEGLSELFSQLYQSSQPSELDKVYFDMKDVLTEEVDGDSGLSSSSRSILMEQESSKETQDSNSHGETMETGSNSQQSMSTSQEQSQLLSQMSVASSAFSTQRYLSLSSHPHAIPMVHHPRLILCGAQGMGQSSLLSPALLHTLEEFPVKTLDLTTVFATSTKTPEEACTQVRTFSDYRTLLWCMQF